MKESLFLLCFVRGQLKVHVYKVDSAVQQTQKSEPK